MDASQCGWPDGDVVSFAKLQTTFSEILLKSIGVLVPQVPALAKPPGIDKAAVSSIVGYQVLIQLDIVLCLRATVKRVSKACLPSCRQSRSALGHPWSLSIRPRLYKGRGNRVTVSSMFYGIAGVCGACGGDSIRAQFVAVTQRANLSAGGTTWWMVTFAPPCGSLVQTRMA